MFSSDELVSALVSDIGAPLSRSGDALTALRTVMALLACGAAATVDPTPLHRALPEPFSGFGQQDATEFARYLLDGLTTVGADGDKARAAVREICVVCVLAMPVATIGRPAILLCVRRVFGTRRCAQSAVALAHRR